MATEDLGAKACKPRACLRVGVTGHRTGPKLPPEIEPAIRATVDGLFTRIAAAFAETARHAGWAFAAEPPELVVVSALAEGTDRIVAAAGLAAGATLDCILPSSQAVYERDFETEASKAQFRGLLEKARAIFALDMPDGVLGEKRGYEAAGLIMLAHTDLLIAVWDGGEAAGIGGTASIVEQAATEGVPILLISPSAPSEARLLWTGDMELPPAKIRLEDLPTSPIGENLPGVVQALVAPPVDPDTKAGLEAFYEEPTRPAHGWPLYSALLATLAVRPLRSTDFRAGAEHPYSADDWRQLFPDPDDPLTEAVCETLLPAITLPDRLAVRYAELYRSAFVFNFLASAVAVLFALTGLATELPLLREHMAEAGQLGFKAGLVAGEIILLSAIVIIWRRGAHRGWHRRWLDYRRASEWLRYLRVLSLVGARAAIQRPRRTAPARTEAGRGQRVEQDDWVGWYVRSISRRLPPPKRAVDNVYVEAVRAAVIETELDVQIAYHHRNHYRMALAAHRLHQAGLVLFATPMIVGAAYIAAYALYLASREKMLLAFQMRFYVTALTASLPAFGAALNAIRVQGDFETVSRRSEAAAARLASIRQAMHDDPPEFARLADRIQRAVAVMGAEHSEWRTLFGTRPLSLPA